MTMKNEPRRTLLASAMMTALAMSCTATAQDQPATTAVETKDVNAAENAADATSLPTITVTAEKRSQNVRKVPSSISVVSSEQLETNHVASLVDLAGALPGVQIDTGGSPGQTSIAIRGISSLGQGAVVGTYIDDSPLGSSANFARASSYQLDLLPYDIDHIEVLRGPQGTLYGAGAMGGLIKYVMKDPDLEYFTGRVGGGISSISGSAGTGWDARANVNVPLIKEKLAVTASVSQNDTPGYIDNPVSGQDDINDVSQKSARAALLWKPNEDVTLKLSALHQSVDVDDSGIVMLDPTTQQPIYGERTAGTVLSQPFRSKINFYAASLNWNLGWGDFTSATSYSKSELEMVADNSATYGPLFPLFGYDEGLSPFDLGVDLKKVTQEFRFASNSDQRLEWQIGAFYTREKSANFQTARALATDGSSLPGIDPLLDGVILANYKEGALFGDLTYKFTDKFAITGGLRYARNEQTFEQQVNGGILVPIGSTFGESSENVLTWMLSPTYQLSDDSMLYLRIATGYRPGGPNFALPDVPPTVESDELINYEIGWKSLFYDKKLSVDFSVYKINWKDIQINATTPNGTLGYTANGGTATSQGAELSLALMPIQGLRLGLNGAYTDAHLTEDAPSLEGKSGDRIPYIPRLTWSYSTDYYFSFGSAWTGHVGGTYRWTGERPSNVSSNPFTYWQSSYGVLDLNADISKGMWRVQFYVKNMTNKNPNLNIAYLQNGATGDVAFLSSTMLQPRTFGVSIDFQF